MKIAMLSASTSRSAGGVFEAVRCLSRDLTAIPGVAVEVFAGRDPWTTFDLPSWAPLRPQVFPVRRPVVFGWAAGLAPALASWEPDLVHLHALWMYPSVVACRWGRRTQKPVLISAHGMLDPWALQNAAWKKRVALSLFERRNLTGAACFQAISRAELEAIRALGLTQAVAVIPNGVDLPRLEAGIAREAGGRTKVLLFLGRIHPKKGLVPLVRAWNRFQASDPTGRGWVLAIAGWDQGGHEQELRELVTATGGHLIDDQTRAETLPDFDSMPGGSVIFLSPRFGASKEALLRRCDAFVLPSFSEGLPMAVLEAWSYAKPVLMTVACNLPEGFAAGAAICLTPDDTGVLRGLNELVQLPPPTLAAMGAAGRSLVEARFTWPQVARQLHAVYYWLLRGGEPPHCLDIATP